MKSRINGEDDIIFVIFGIGLSTSWKILHNVQQVIRTSSPKSSFFSEIDFRVRVGVVTSVTSDVKSLFLLQTRNALDRKTLNSPLIHILCR